MKLSLTRDTGSLINIRFRVFHRQNPHAETNRAFLELKCKPGITIEMAFVQCLKRYGVFLESDWKNARFKGDSGVVKGSREIVCNFEATVCVMDKQAKIERSRLRMLMSDDDLSDEDDKAQSALENEKIVPDFMKPASQEHIRYYADQVATIANQESHRMKTKDYSERFILAMRNFCKVSKPPLPCSALYLVDHQLAKWAFDNDDLRQMDARKVVLEKNRKKVDTLILEGPPELDLPVPVLGRAPNPWLNEEQRKKVGYEDEGLVADTHEEMAAKVEVRRKVRLINGYLNKLADSNLTVIPGIISIIFSDPEVENQTYAILFEHICLDIQFRPALLRLVNALPDYFRAVFLQETSTVISEGYKPIAELIDYLRYRLSQSTTEVIRQQFKEQIERQQKKQIQIQDSSYSLIAYLYVEGLIKPSVIFNFVNRIMSFKGHPSVYDQIRRCNLILTIVLDELIKQDYAVIQSYVHFLAEVIVSDPKMRWSLKEECRDIVYRLFDVDQDLMRKMKFEDAVTNTANNPPGRAATVGVIDKSHIKDDGDVVEHEKNTTAVAHVFMVNCIQVADIPNKLADNEDHVQNAASGFQTALDQVERSTGPEVEVGTCQEDHKLDPNKHEYESPASDENESTKAPCKQPEPTPLPKQFSRSKLGKKDGMELKSGNSRVDGGVNNMDPSSSEPPQPIRLTASSGGSLAGSTRPRRSVRPTIYYNVAQLKHAGLPRPKCPPDHIHLQFILVQKEATHLSIVPVEEMFLPQHPDLTVLDLLHLIRPLFRWAGYPQWRRAKDDWRKTELADPASQHQYRFYVKFFKS